MKQLAGIFLLGIFCGFLYAGEVTFTDKEQVILDQAQVVSKAFEIVAAKVRPAVVNIQAELPGVPISQGSGVVVDSRGFILTNSHVVRGAQTIVVRLLDGREFPAELVGDSPESDVAVVRVRAPDLTVASMGDSDQVRVGAMVLAIGNPFGLESTVTSGIVSAKGRSNVVRLEIADFLQTDAPINLGNSGGPLVNLKGEIIGINSVTNSNSEGLSFAIPINLARTVMNGIISHKNATSSYLGVAFEPVTSKIADAFGLQAARGALITKVVAGTPAARAGLKSGDIIVKYGTRAIRDDNQLRTLVAITQPGEMVKVEYYRKGKLHTTEVTVESLPEQVIVARRSRKFLENLGIVKLTELTPKIRKQLGYEEGAKGVLVEEVATQSPAQRLISPGSLILSVNNKEINTPEELHTAIGEAEGCVTLSWRFGRFYTSRRIICQ